MCEYVCNGTALFCIKNSEIQVEVYMLDILEEQPSSAQKRNWKRAVEKLDYAFQPIINIHSGVCYGYEALLRNFTEAGFQSIEDVFNQAYSDRKLFPLDLYLREKALEKFSCLPYHNRMKLFYNLDNRVLVMPDFSAERTTIILEKYDIHPGAVCLEISEKHDFETFILNDISSLNEIKNILNYYRQGLFRIAIDDFGSGLSGLEMLYHTEPDYIKIDRFFIKGIAGDPRKKLLLSSTLKMAHILGIMVIAEGVETIDEFYACKQIGCDFIQGYLIQRPTVALDELCEQYEIVKNLNSLDKREMRTDNKMIQDHLEYIEPISLSRSSSTLIDIDTVFETFRKHKVNSFFPVTNGNGEPVGVIREKDLKEYVYSPYGKDLLKNKTAGKITSFVSKIPVSDINTRVEKILEVFSIDAHSEGILITDNGSYIGYLSTNSLIKLLNEKNLAEARDQNPLTKLPGNTVINRFISTAIHETEEQYVFVYFDFDNFKPFNDEYGFRQGDRAILIFSDILKDMYNRKKCFIGHIGGDDFFAAFKCNEHTMDDIDMLIESAITRFSDDVISMYSPEHRQQGYTEALNRDGIRTSFPLLGVSAGILVVPSGPRTTTQEEMFTRLAHLKKQAKKSTSRKEKAVLDI